MSYKYPISKFDLAKFLKNLDPKLTCEKSDDGNNLILLDQVECNSIENLRAIQDGRILGIVGFVDIYSHGLLLAEYNLFCAIEMGEEEDVIEDRGKEEYERILSIAEERGWEENESMNRATMDDGVSVAVLVSLSGDDITIESGYAGEDLMETGTYFGGGIDGMPEIESMIKDLVKSCVRKAKKR